MVEKEKPAPSHQESSILESDALLLRLLNVQRDIRDILTEYKIQSGSLSAMAHQARKLISNAEVRADFLELLIDLQEIGALAKRRRILDEAEITGDGALSIAASRATARRHGMHTEMPEEVKQETRGSHVDANTRDVDQQASDDFFNSLNHRPD